MSKEEYIQRLTENPYIADVEENWKYKLPVVRYYMEHYAPVQTIINTTTGQSTTLDFKTLTITEPITEQSKQGICIAFESLTKRVDEFKET